MSPYFRAHSCTLPSALRSVSDRSLSSLSDKGVQGDINDYVNFGTANKNYNGNISDGGKDIYVRNIQRIPITGP